MKNLLGIGLIACAIVGASMLTQGQQQQQAVEKSNPVVSSNRFTLFSATVEETGETQVVESKKLFKLDTWTGQTWVFSGYNHRSDLLENWNEVVSFKEAMEDRTLRQKHRNK